MNRDERNTAVEDVQARPPVQMEVPRPGLLQIMWQRRRIVFVTVIVCLGVGLGYLVQATPIYTSTSRLYVEQKGPKIISEAQGVMTESKNYLYTQSELVKSTPIIADVLEQSDIKTMETFTDVDNQVGFLKKELDVSVGKKDDIISISLDSPYPQEAAHIVNAVVDAYVTYHATKKRSTAAEVLKILEKQKTKRDAELTKKLQDMLQFRRENAMLSFEDDKGNVVIQQLVRLSDALTDARLDTIDAKAAFEAAKAMMDDPAKMRQLIRVQYARGVYVALDREEEEIRRNLSYLDVQLETLRQKCTEGAPSVRATNAKIDKLKKQLADRDGRFAEAYLAAVRQRSSTAVEKQAELQRAFDKQQELAEELNIKIAEYALLQTDLIRTERDCDIIDSRIKEINVTEDTGALNISILEVAKPEEKPTKPKKSRIMAIALVLGLMLGVGLSLVRDWMDQRLRSAEEISATLDTPVLGVVPHIVGKISPTERGQQVHRDPQSHVAEAYRTIRTAVYFGVPDGQAKTLLVTSPSPGDGKTTLASNLAIAMAQSGQRTLILDADFRKPMQHNVFKVKDDSGLSNVLAGIGTLDEVIQHTGVDGLDILPCGPIPPNPSEMLNSRPFAETMEELSKMYDRILVDSPPVMPVADARILGAMTDVTLLVLRAEKSTRKAAEQAREGLLSVGANILGVVVNDVPRRSGRYGSYGYYSGYGYYGYGYGRKSREREGQGAAGEAKSVVAESRGGSETK